MFDNFVISDDDETSIAEPLDAENMVTETVEPKSEIAEAQVAEVQSAEPEAAQEQETQQFAALELEPEPKAPSYSQDELDAAVSAAEERSYEKGFNAATADVQKQQQAVLEEINSKLLSLLAEQDNSYRQDEQNALKFALGLVRKLLPNLEADVAKEEVEAFLSDNFAKFKGEKSLSFSFNPKMAANIAPLLSKLAEKNDFEGKIAVHKDINLGLSDCAVEWKNGGVTRSAEQILDNVENLLNK